MSLLRRQVCTSIALLSIAMLVAGVFSLLLILRFAREELRGQILSRDATMLSALAVIEDEALDPSLSFAWLEFVDRASELRGVLGISILDLDGVELEALPRGLRKSVLDEQRRSALEAGGHFAMFHPHMIEDVLFRDGGLVNGLDSISVEEIIVPVVSILDGETIAYARFWIEGESIEAEFQALDRNLWRAGLLAGLVLCVLVVLPALWAAWRLLGLAKDLEGRTADLEKANGELEMAARSAAVGAIAGHLMHGIKNPLAGLRAYLRSDGHGQARAAAERMQSLVAETLAVLRTEERGRAGAVSSVELAKMIEARWADEADRDWRLDLSHWDAVDLPRRQLQITRLILENLIQNAADAVPAGSKIAVELKSKDLGVEIRVRDQGPGISDELRSRLFEPGQSTKPEGGGLGLAISRQLARALGGILECEQTGPKGTTFLLRISRE